MGGGGGAPIQPKYKNSILTWAKGWGGGGGGRKASDYGGGTLLEVTALQIPFGRLSMHNNKLNID